LIIQFVYNISIYKATKQTLFFINHRFHLIIYKTSTIRPDNLYITIKVKHFKFLYNKLKNELSFVKNRIARYYYIKKIKRPSFKERDKIYLFCKNIIIKRPNDKLDIKKFRPFIIVQKISKNNYKLSLSKTIQIYFIFYISLFEPTPKSA